MVILMKKKYFKYNKDDILEILTETLAVENGFDTFSSNSNLIIDNDEIFFVGVIGELDDEEVDTADLDKIYSEIEYNGTHGINSFSPTKSLSDALKKAIKTRDF